MSRPRFFTDEDMHGPVAPQLHILGFDAISTPEANRLSEPDESQFDWAASEGRVIVTFNVGDFTRLHYERIVRGDHHAGLVVWAQRPIGDMVRRLPRLAMTLDANDLCDRLVYLSDWPPA